MLLVAAGLAIIGKGAFYRQGQIVAGSALAFAFALALLLSRGRLFAPALPRSIVLVVVSQFAFGLWAVARAALAGDDLGGLSLLALAAALSAGFVLGHLATPPQRRALRQAIIVLGVASAAAGWAGLVWRIDSLAIPGRAWRASGTLTYENALACLLAVVAVVVVAELVERETPVLGAALCVILAGAAASQSRGGAVALLLGAVTLCGLLGWRAVLRVAWRPGIGATIAAVCLVPSMPVTSSPRPLPAVIGLCLGLAVAAWPRDRLPAVGPVGTSKVVGVAVVAVAGIVLALQLGGIGMGELTGGVNWSSRHRVSQHRVAIAELAEQPLVGTGPGHAVLRWRDAGRTLQARFVHNEYLQVAVELGLIGGALLLLMLVALGHAVWQGRAAGGLPWAGVVAAGVVIAVHGGLDFVWHLPAIPFIAVLLAGTATEPAA
jgi:hypothetical protein